MSASHIPSLNEITFQSLYALRAAHQQLIRRRHEIGDTDELLTEVDRFMQRAQATGALLDANDERQSAQSLLDYWATVYYRLGDEPPDSTLADFNPQLAPNLPDELCPYVGLDAFREADGEKFFGRHALIARLVEQLADQRLLAVVGPSGSGKSSVVRAGLIPALKNGALPDSQSWQYLPPIVPGSDPLESFDRVLRLGSMEPNTAARLPVPDTFLLSSPTVIFVDQFEELFTLCDDDQARQTFIARLLELIRQPDMQHRVILSMRSDFETFVARSPELQSLFYYGRVQVTALTAFELREAIEQPAAAVGLKFEDGIIQLLLQDILGEPAGLPLLQFTLLKLWERRERNRVTRASYERIGGGRLALASSADEFYNGLIPEDRVTAQRILLRMVRPGEGLEITSSRLRREELYRGGEDPGRVERVLAKLIDTRLVRLTAGETPEDDQVEVAHEALVRNWPTLVEWLEQEKAAITTRRRLEAKAVEWVRLGQGKGGLLDEVELHEAERWLTSAEAAYLGYDPALAVLVHASRIATQQQATEQKQVVRRLQLLVAILAIISVVSTMAALLLYLQR
jgi:hypothetical protein